MTRNDRENVYVPFLFKFLFVKKNDEEEEEGKLVGEIGATKLYRYAVNIRRI